MSAQHMPTVRYHPVEPPRLLQTLDDLAALDETWQDHPYTDEEQAQWQAAHAPEAGVPVATINPEVYTLVLRSVMGEGTADEHAIVGAVIAYLMRDALGTATTDEARTVETALQEFGIPLAAAERQEG